MQLPVIALFCTLAFALAMVVSGRGKLGAKVLGLVVGLYFLGRAIAEPFVIDMTDPSSYQNDWGGPSLAGVLAVHCGPGIIVLVIVGWLIRRLATRRSVKATGQSARDNPLTCGEEWSG
jgi:hypothetical protein